MEGQEITYVAWNLPPTMTEMFLIPISDIHKGNPSFSEKHLDRTIDFIKNTPNAYWVNNADWLECATRSSKGDVYTQTESPQAQADWCIKKFKPIAGRGLGADSGNHENRIYQESGVDLSKYMAESLEIPYKPQGMLLKISFGAGNSRHPDRPYVFWVYMTHGWGGARTTGAKAKKVEDQSHYVTADLHIMSHDHVVNVAPVIELQADARTYSIPDGNGGQKKWQEGKVKAKRVMLVKSNAYLKWGGYSQRYGYPPSDLETPVIKLLTPDSPLWKSYPGKAKQAIKVEV
jgi:hypothetical protein